MIEKVKRRGRPAVKHLDTRTHVERLDQRKQQRQQKAVNGAKAFASLPDCARIRQPLVEILHGISAATVWRRVKSGILPPPHVNGRIATWSAGEIRTSLTMPLPPKVGGNHVV